jgi:nitroreductase
MDSSASRGAPECVASLLNRYSMGIKHLVEPGPDDDQLRQIIEAALRAPDHGELTPFRFCVIRDAARERLADLFEASAQARGKTAESCALERERALRAPLSIAVIGRVDLYHPMVPAHEQWACIGGALTNMLNAVHMLGFAGKMLSGEKVRDAAIIAAFCKPGETLTGWLSIGTAAKEPGVRKLKPVESVLSFF